MPELAEVEVARRVAEGVALGRRIVEVDCADDPIVVAGCGPREVEAALEGARVLAARRYGKYLWLELDRRPWPLIHLGMTGALRTPEDRPLRLASSPRVQDTSWPPRWCKLRIGLEGGGELAFVNKRRLGRLRLREDPSREPPVANLGFDPYLNLPDSLAFDELLGRRRGNVKGLLLDQAFAAGVGNWLADEILHAAGLDPRRRVPELSPNEVETLRIALGDVVSRAVAVDADSARFPEHWLFHRRWQREKRSSHEVDGLRRERVAGRSTVWDPTRQV